MFRCRPRVPPARRVSALSLPHFALAGSLIASSAVARAQTPDVRNLKPVMVLLLDTSGSMERKAGCACTTDSCAECLPNCDANEKNRWATTLEALTGTFSSFSCTARPRTVDNGMSYDVGYYIPHHDPPDSDQNSDGILDSYAGQVKFALMTFDGMPTAYGKSPMVPVASWSEPESTGEPGMWSYAGAKSFNFPGCLTDFKMDTGVRSASASEGELISVGSDSADLAAINDRIQSSLLATRPFGGTPIAAALDDLHYYFENHVDVKSGGDPYYSCRRRYALLLSDGVPDPDFREYGCDQAGYTCPYPLAEDLAAYLRCGSGATSCSTASGPIEKLYVVGFSTANQSVKDTLNALASNGGSGSALFADGLSQLRGALASVLDWGIGEATSRSAPSFSNSVSGSSTAQQFQVNAGFLVGKGSEPWEGYIERRRFVCDGTSITEPALSSQDKFHEVLNARGTARDLWTVKPAAAALDAHLWKGSLGAPCASDGCSNLAFTKANIDPPDLGLVVENSTRRDAIVDWVHAESSSARAEKRLGDVYHSSPLAVGPPQFDSPDHSYNLFRRKLEVRSRPLALYVGTNDGIVHAFALDDYPADASDTAHAGTTFSAGDEMWGFVPPILMSKLDAAVDAHQFLADGSPVVKDVYFSRTPGATPSPDAYRTLLVTGMRGGGKGYVALDVTDPVEPKFLWQFTHRPSARCEGCDADCDAAKLAAGTCTSSDIAYSGYSYGQAALGQVLVNYEGTVQERAVAVLSGGKGLTSSSLECNSYRDSLGQVPQSHASIDRDSGSYGLLTPHRAKVRCWQGEGRSVFIVDAETGTLLKQIDERVFPAPVAGSVAIFNGDVGTVATRAFVTDQDGVIWRIDLTGTDPVPGDPHAGWTARPFHDLYYDKLFSEGRPGYERPALSVDTQGRLVVVQGTGDPDDLTSGAAHAVVSLTERLALHADGTTQLDATRAAINWTKTLATGESVTGPVELFDGNVYFASFRSQTGPDACAFGESHVHAFDYIDDDGAAPPGPVATSGVGGLVGSSHANKLFMGVGITQRPQCFDTSTISDPYMGGSRAAIPPASAPEFHLVLNAGGDASADKGGVIKTESMAVPTPASLTRITSIAGTVD
ncbi:MAG: hypothetical protein MJD61_18585 [Proteobacteria bacterium]|nr:hypothetical protein [Pseudomonadota bacterium]